MRKSTIGLLCAQAFLMVAASGCMPLAFTNATQLDPDAPATQSAPIDQTVTAGTKAIQEELPLAPAVAGDWTLMKPGWDAWCEKFLSQALQVPIEIQGARHKRVPFYSTPDRTVVLIEAMTKDGSGAYYILSEAGGTQDVLLNGAGIVIQQANQAFGLSLQTAETAFAYFKFFVSSMAGEGGVFYVVEPQSDLMPSAVEAQLGVKAPVISGTPESGWQIETDVIHGDTFASAVFKVTADGLVEMLSDTPRFELSLIYRVTMKNALRSHVKVQ